MHKSKLFILVKGFRGGELHWFQKFLTSPFYNSNEEVIRLFNYIKKYYPNLENPKLAKELVFKKLYPKEKYDVQKLRKIMHGLASLAEEFIVAKHLKDKTFEKNKVLVDALKERNIYKQFQKETEEMLMNLERLPYRDSEVFQSMHELNYMYYDHIETSKQGSNTDVLKNASLYLDYFYLSQRQQLDLAIIWQRKLLGEKIKKTSLQQAKRSLSEMPVFKIYHLISDAVNTSWNDERYEEVKKIFAAEVEQLSPKNKRIIIKILLNYLSSQINKGNFGYQAKMLLLYRFGLTQELLIENDQISEATFGNIITVGLFEKEFDWVEDFIKKYNAYLPDSIKEDATCLGIGLMYYHKKEFPKAIDLILNHSFSKPLLILRSKTTLLRAYFEQYLIDNSYYDFLIAQTQSFEKHIRRNDLISEGKKESYLNFILFIRKITVAHNKHILDKKFYKKIQDTEPVLLKFWLLERLKEVL